MTSRSPLSDLLARPRACRWLAALGLALGLAAWRGLWLWSCPLLAATELPCPACGLTRATVALACGEPRAALALHPFAPLVLLCAVLIALGALLPPRARAVLATWVERADPRGRTLLVALFALLAWWLLLRLRDGGFEQAPGAPFG
jgi:Protein of unknown function (DUF2752)